MNNDCCTMPEPFTYTEFDAVAGCELYWLYLR